MATTTRRPTGPPTQLDRTGGDGLAVAALVCGLLAATLGVLSILLLPAPFAVLLGVAAAVLGVLGLRRADTQGGAGRGMAITGLVTGLLGLATGAAALVLLPVVRTVSSGTEVIDGRSTRRRRRPPRSSLTAGCWLTDGDAAWPA